MKSRLTALGGLLVLALLFFVALSQPAVLPRFTDWPKRKLVGGVLLCVLLIWMWLYERHRAKHPQQRFLNVYMRRGKVIAKRTMPGRFFRKDQQ